MLRQVLNVDIYRSRYLLCSVLHTVIGVKLPSFGCWEGRHALYRTNESTLSCATDMKALGINWKARLWLASLLPMALSSILKTMRRTSASVRRLEPSLDPKSCHLPKLVLSSGKVSCAAALSLARNAAIGTRCHALLWWTLMRDWGYDIYEGWIYGISPVLCPGELMAEIL